jgi:hypothetical protein
MPIQPKTRRPDLDQPRGIADAAIEGAMEADEISNADTQFEPAQSAGRGNPDIEKFHDDGDAHGRGLDDEWEVLEE